MYEQNRQNRQNRQNMQSEFTHRDNKARLWKILQTNGFFNGIDNSLFSKVRDDFEKTILLIDQTYPENTIMDKRKLFVDGMITKLEVYKQQSNPVSILPDTTPGNIPDMMSHENNENSVYTVEKIRQSRLDAFDSELNQKQNEFNMFNAKPLPPKVEFADKDDNDSGDVNQLLEKAMRERENLNLPMPPVDSNKVKNQIPKEENIKLVTASANSYANSVANGDANSDANSVANNNNDLLLRIMKKLEDIEQMIKEEREKKS